jgi:hypothetical protein
MRARSISMSLAVAATFALAAPALADSATDVPPHAPGGGDSIEPGKVGPGSEKNSQVSPTSPSIPMSKQPPAEINAPAGSTSGTSTGERGSGPEGTTPPHNPTSPGLQ